MTGGAIVAIVKVYSRLNFRMNSLRPAVIIIAILIGLVCSRQGHCGVLVGSDPTVATSGDLDCSVGAVGGEVSETFESVRTLPEMMFSPNHHSPVKEAGIFGGVWLVMQQSVRLSAKRPPPPKPLKPFGSIGVIPIVSGTSN